MTMAVVAGTEHDTGYGFSAEGIRAFEETGSYRDNSTAWVVPLRNEFVHLRVLGSWMVIEWPENQSRTGLIAEVGKEVGAAYESLFEKMTNRDAALAAFGPENTSRIEGAHFVLTCEADNILPPKAVKKLLQAIYTCPDCGGEVGNDARAGVTERDDAWVCAAGHRGFDAVSGLYFMKTEPPIPMAFGDPRDISDMRPQSIERPIASGAVIEVNGIAMGCAIWRKGMFAKVSRPWFQTTPNNTQDIFFCRKAKAETGARFGVHCGVRVGHMDLKTGEIV